MNRFCNALALGVLSASLVGGSAYAQDHHDQDHHDKDNHHYVEHKEWKKGQHIRHEDWDRGERFDYHRYHLNAPPRGYEWRMIDGNYVMVNIGNFQIRAVVVPH
ncbi:MAG: RcnB family protein [Terracidiphilus sp.]